MSEDFMLSCSFNQTKTLFTIGTMKSFRIYRINPEFPKIKNRLTLYERVLDGAISICEVYFESNLIVLVGGCKIPKFQKNKVIFWDEEKCKITNEMVFNTFIKNVKLKADYIFVSTESALHVINLLSLQEIDSIDLTGIPKNCSLKGLFSINTSSTSTILCCPDQNEGFIKIKNYDDNTTLLLNAHKSSIDLIQLSDDGNIVATASQKGNIVRIFRTMDGLNIGKLRVAKNGRKICNIAFDSHCDTLAVNCSCGEIFIYDISEIKKKAYSNRKESSNAPMKFNSFKIKEIKRDDYRREKTILEKIGFQDY